MSRLIVMITYHLEQNPLPCVAEILTLKGLTYVCLRERRCSLLQCIQALLSNSFPTSGELSSTRLVKGVMLSLMPLLSTQSDAHTGEMSSGQSKKGRKRRRDYEGDELFKLSKDVICSSIAEGKVILCALDGEFRSRSAN